MSDVGIEFIINVKNKTIDYKNLIKEFFNNLNKKFSKSEPRSMPEYVPKSEKKLHRILSIKKVIFPCKDCLVLPAGCSVLCDKVEMDNKKVMKLFLKHECCIDCGSTHLLEGPSGGMSQNIKCANCGHRFNLALPVFIERI